MSSPNPRRYRRRIQVRPRRDETPEQRQALTLLHQSRIMVDVLSEGLAEQIRRCDSLEHLSNLELILDSKLRPAIELYDELSEKRHALLDAEEDFE